MTSAGVNILTSLVICAGLSGTRKRDFAEGHRRYE